jgi:hypothetical protein
MDASLKHDLWEGDCVSAIFVHTNKRGERGKAGKTSHPCSAVNAGVNPRVDPGVGSGVHAGVVGTTSGT